MNAKKSKIFIVSSNKASTLAERLQDALRTDFCEATVWSERDRLQCGRRAIDELESAAEDFDFAAVLLVKADLMPNDTAEDRRSRDNSIFEAGHFAAVNGKDRCVLVHGVDEQNLPVDLGNLQSIPLEEPEDLTDGPACAAAIAPVAEALKKMVSRMGLSTFHARIPLLSNGELFRREQPREDGGDLREGGRVVVCDTQPMGDIPLILQVRRNMDFSTSYHYFLYLTEDCIDKTCHAVQVLVFGGLGAAEIATDFNARVGLVKDRPTDVVRDLERMCSSRRLRITFMRQEPQFRFRAHNASNPDLARLYARYREHGFLLWAESRNAMALWEQLPVYLSEEPVERIFLPLKVDEIEGESWRAFERQLDRAMHRYFPGIESEVKQILIGRRPS